MHKERKPAVPSDASCGCMDFCILDRNMAAWFLATHFPSKVSLQDACLTEYPLRALKGGATSASSHHA